MPTRKLNLRECHCQVLRQAARLATQFYDRHLTETSLRTTQLPILDRLRRHGPMTINALAQELLMDRTALGRNILPLKRDGLVIVERSAADARRKELRLTRKGSAKLAGALEQWAEAQKAFEAAYGRKRSAQLRSLLRAVASELGAPDFRSRDYLS